MKHTILKNMMIKNLESKFGHRESASLVKLYFEDISFPESLSDDEIKDRISHDMDLLLDDYPLQYITGKVFFYDTMFRVEEGVLIPRPETEELVHLIIEENKLIEGLKVLDVGAGTGCIALTLARHLRSSEVISVDISEKAIEISRLNNLMLGQNVDFKLLDFLIRERWSEISDIDILVSNPPYVQLSEKSMMSKSTLVYEPSVALFPQDEDALIFYRAILEFAINKMKKASKIYLEINEFLSEETIDVFESYGLEALIIKDIQGKPRILKVLV